MLFNFILYLTAISELVRGTSYPNNAIGSCTATAYPWAFSKMLEVGDRLVAFYDEEKLKDSLSEFYPSKREYPFFNREFVIDRMGGQLQHCDMVANAFMAAGNNEFYAKMFDTVLRNIPDFNIVIQDNLEVVTQGGEFTDVTSQLTLFVNDKASSREGFLTILKHKIQHEMMHALISVAGKNYGEFFLQNSGYFSARKEDFAIFYKAFRNGCDKVASIKDKLYKYRTNQHALSATDKKEIEFFLAVVEGMVDKNGIPSLELTMLKKNIETIFVKKSGKIIRFKELLEDGTLMVENPLKSTEEFVNSDGLTSTFFISFEDPAWTYLNTMQLSCSTALKNPTYQSEFLKSLSDELFTLSLTTTHIEISQYFFVPLYQKIFSIQKSLEHENTPKPILRQWRNSYLYHPDHMEAADNVVDIHQIKHQQGLKAVDKLLTPAVVEASQRACEQILNFKDQGRYFAVQSVLQTQIDLKKTSGVQTWKAQAMLIEVSSRINMEKPAESNQNRKPKNRKNNYS